MSQHRNAGQAAWPLLTQGVSSAQVEVHRLRHLFSRAMELVQKSEQREHIYQVAGDIITGLPTRIEALEQCLERTAYALAVLVEDDTRGKLPLSDRKLVDDAVHRTKPLPSPSRVASKYASRERRYEVWARTPLEARKKFEAQFPGLQIERGPYLDDPSGRAGDPRVFAIHAIRGRRADMTPPLGFPGGPCYVVDRIRRHTPNERLKENLISDVTRGLDLSNPNAAKVYPLTTTQLPKSMRFNRLIVGPHTAYRMDLRGITLPEIKLAMKSFVKQWMDHRSRKSPVAVRWEQDMMRSEGIKWTDPRIRLTIVFAVRNHDVKLITAYWEGKPDPRPPGSQGCE